MIVSFLNNIDFVYNYKNYICIILFNQPNDSEWDCEQKILMENKFIPCIYVQCGGTEFEDYLGFNISSTQGDANDTSYIFQVTKNIKVATMVYEIGTVKTLQAKHRFLHLKNNVCSG